MPRANPLVLAAARASKAAEDHGLSRCHCLAHGQGKVRELEAGWPQERAGVTPARKQGGGHEAEARVRQLSAEERLASPHASRGPLRDTLKQWLEHQGSARAVEPNRSLGKALA